MEDKAGMKRGVGGWGIIFLWRMSQGMRTGDYKKTDDVCHGDTKALNTVFKVCLRSCLLHVLGIPRENAVNAF